jgi:DNA-binding XRE family transcriptional regulator
LQKHRDPPNLSGLLQIVDLTALCAYSAYFLPALTQENLALLAEVDRSYVGRVERGDNNVAILTLAKIAKALGISVAKLMKKAKL